MSTKVPNQAESSILTYLRVRRTRKPSEYIYLEPNSILFSLPKTNLLEHVNNKKLQQTFQFNGVFNADATQDEVFEEVGVPAVQNALKGFNSTIFAYGQTGSGKTFTLTGGPSGYAERGLISRAISMIYEECKNCDDLQIKAHISYLEIYNENGYDLLDPAHEGKPLEELQTVKMLKDENGEFRFTNLSVHLAETEDEALSLLAMGDMNRTISETPLNLVHLYNKFELLFVHTF